MGLEAECTVRYRGQEVSGRALLETEELLFRGPVRLRIPFGSVTALDADDHALHVTFGEEQVSFTLGPASRKWAEKIRNPRTRLDKLGVKPGQRVGLVGKVEPAFLEELRGRGVSPEVGAPGGEYDLLFLAAEERPALDTLEALKGRLRRSGALWVLRRKGNGPVTEADVMASGKAAGLVDVKVVRFSDTHTAEKLVIPVKSR